MLGDLFKRYAEQSRLLSSYRAPIDHRIQTWLNDVLPVTGEKVDLPSRTVIIDRYGLAREMSLPESKSEHCYKNSQITSHRLRNGILNNPLNDRRTTKGSFHVADYGFKVPKDKIKVPLVTFAHLLKYAFLPPTELNVIPYTSKWNKPCESLVSLLLRPLVCPEVPGVRAEKRLEVRFLVPGGLVQNLDFVESIFGNAGDPFLPENDAALDTEGWTGTTGCVVLAPHLRSLKKKDVGLPNKKDATEDQIKTGMCWEDENELYNSGKPFKITCRDDRGIMVTVLADNYMGYSKKEVKTQIGFTANIIGLAEEEHAGGALAFRSYNLGLTFKAGSRMGFDHEKYSFEHSLKLLGDTVTLHKDGYGMLFSP